MRNLLLFFVILLSSCWGVLAQNSVKGVLLDDEKGEALPFVQVYLDGTNHWGTTDLNGYFLITRIPNGDYTLKVRYMGYEEYSQPVSLNNKSITVNIKLKSTKQLLKGLVVKSKKQEERKVHTQVSVEKITSSQIKQMPSIGGQADLAQYLQVLPGVNSTGDQGGQLYIRGGSMIQNLTMLDGMVVYNPFHSIGLYSIFETDVILNADIYTGGFGAEYGGRLSSVMDITTRDGNKKRHTGKIGLNTFGASLILEGPLKQEKQGSHATMSYLLTAKNSYLSQSSTLLYPYIEGGLPFDFTDLYGKISINSGMGSKINFFGFRFDDRVNGYQAIADFHWLNYGAGTNFAIMTGASALLDGSVAYSNYKVTLSDASGLPKYSGIGGFNMSLNITNFYGDSKLRAGVNMEGYSTDYQYTNIYGVPRSQSEHSSTLSGFVSYHLQKGKLLIDPGVRLVYYASLMEASIEPRLALKYNISDEIRLKFAGGHYSQTILDARSDRDIVNLFNGFLTGSGQLNLPTYYNDAPVESCLQRAQHLVLGVELDLIEHLTVNVEGYLKNFRQLIGINHNQIYDRTDPAYQTGGAYEKPQYLLTDFLIEKGMAAGIDVNFCYDLEQLYLWATYSLGFVQRTDELLSYNPHYDRRHTVNLLATYTFGDDNQWEFSGRWSFGSGFPFTQTMGVYENVLFRDGIGSRYWNSNGDFGVHYGELYAGRLPAYHRLDLGVKRKFSIGKRGILELSLSATNVYNRNNLFYFDRLTFKRVDQLPILVSFGASLKF